MELIVALLTVACLLLSATTATLAASIPFLWWKYFHQQEKIESIDKSLSALQASWQEGGKKFDEEISTLDEALTHLMEVAGVPKNQ